MRAGRSTWGCDAPASHCLCLCLCLRPLPFSSAIDALKEDQFDGEKSSRQWFYQTCNEFGYFQTTASPNSPFYPLKFLTKKNIATEICARVFNISVSPDIGGTNTNYGDLRITAENITFPSGTIDPWHVLAMQNKTQLATKSLRPVYIQGTAHCADMYHPNANDSTSMKWAHQQIGSSIAYYVEGTLPPQIRVQ